MKNRYFFLFVRVIIIKNFKYFFNVEKKTSINNDIQSSNRPIISKIIIVPIRLFSSIFFCSIHNIFWYNINHNDDDDFC